MPLTARTAGFILRHNLDDVRGPFLCIVKSRGFIVTGALSLHRQFFVGTTQANEIGSVAMGPALHLAWRTKWRIRTGSLPTTWFKGG